MLNITCCMSNRVLYMYMCMHQDLHISRSKTGQYKSDLDLYRWCQCCTLHTWRCTICIYYKIV